MIVDADGDGCSHVNFGIGSGTFARSWDIKVIIILVQRFFTSNI